MDEFNGLNSYCTFYFIVERTTIFVKEGHTVNFSCPFKAVTTPITWRGPQNLTTYSIDNDINMQIFKFQRITVIENSESRQYNLSISNFTRADAGLYRCDTMLNKQAIKHEVVVQIAGKIHIYNQIHKTSYDRIINDLSKYIENSQSFRCVMHETVK